MELLRKVSTDYLFEFLNASIKAFELFLDAGPIQLLDFGSNDDKIVTITNGTIEKLFLDPILAERNVVVVSIAGALRKGKSFLINYMLRYMYANVSCSTHLYLKREYKVKISV